MARDDALPRETGLLDRRRAIIGGAYLVGKRSVARYTLLASLVVIFASKTFLHDPVNDVVGQDGLLHQGQRSGFVIAEALTNNGNLAGSGATRYSFA